MGLMAGKEHRISLSTEARSVIEQAKPHARGGYLFPIVGKAMISDTTTSRFMERRGLEARPHVFWSSCRTWCAEATVVPP